MSLSNSVDQAPPLSHNATPAGTLFSDSSYLFGHTSFMESWTSCIMVVCVHVSSDTQTSQRGRNSLSYNCIPHRALHQQYILHLIDTCGMYECQEQMNLVLRCIHVSVRTKLNTVTFPNPWVLYPGFNQSRVENLWKRIPKSYKKQNLNLPQAGNYLKSIYITLGIISNLEMV